MKTILFGVLLVIMGVSVGLGQSVDTTINLNLLRGPVSPAANLLGIAPNDIQRPTDVPGFMVSLQNATQNFTSLPASFAVDIAPYWITGQKGRNLAFSDFKSNKGSIAQTFTFSTAVNYLKTKQNTDSTVQAGLGFRFSILRGKFNGDEVLTLAKSLRQAHQLRLAVFERLEDDSQENSKLTDKLDSLNTAREEFRKIPNKTPDQISQLEKVETDFRIVEAKLIGLRNGFAIEAANQVNAELGEQKRQIENKPLQRYGCKLDVAGGISWDFPQLRFSNAGIAKIGLWVTGGHEDKQGNSFLAIARYLYNPDKVFADDAGKLEGQKNISTVDAGARYNRQGSGSPLSFGTELIYRSVLTVNTLPSSWRWTANFSYEVSRNTVLTLALGRDFDKTFQKDGNVIAFLNFLKGFGSSRGFRE